jgi:hypothetical protein
MATGSTLTGDASPAPADGTLREERGVAVLGSGGSSAYRHGEASESAARSRPRLTASAEGRRHVRPGSQDPWKRPAPPLCAVPA